ncbi:hypothetical protein ACVXG9_24470 [Escherichia coli]
MRCKSWKDGKALPVAKPIMEMRRYLDSYRAIFRKWFIDNNVAVFVSGA